MEHFVTPCDLDVFWPECPTRYAEGDRVLGCRRPGSQDLFRSKKIIADWPSVQGDDDESAGAWRPLPCTCRAPLRPLDLVLRRMLHRDRLATAKGPQRDHDARAATNAGACTLRSDRRERFPTPRDRHS